MTEEEWLESINPRPRVYYLRGKVSERKFRLLACACCRAVWPLLVHERSRKGVEHAEAHAEGLIGDDVLDAACAEASEASDELENLCVEGVGEGPEIVWNAAEAAWSVTAAWQHVCEAPGIAHYCSGQTGEVVALFRDVVGNPFRPVALDPVLLTPTVRALAEATYDERELPSGHLTSARLAILADALEEAGCAEQSVLDHLRSPGPHVRGCWPLDLLLAKE